MTHTPGPWTVVTLPEQKDAFNWAVADGNGSLLAGGLPSGSVARFQSEHDAQAHADNLARLERKAAEDRLHAAAPELLEALTALVDEHFAPKYATGEVRARLWDDARAAIAKAEGR